MRRFHSTGQKPINRRERGGKISMSQNYNFVQEDIFFTYPQYIYIIQCMSS